MEGFPPLVKRGSIIVQRQGSANWGGESDEFYIHDLSGIGGCEDLEQLFFIGGASFDDCSPLVGLSRLITS